MTYLAKFELSEDGKSDLSTENMKPALSLAPVMAVELTMTATATSCSRRPEDEVY